MKKIYKITGLDCAVCAQAVEDELKKLAMPTSVSLNFATGKLYIETDASDADALYAEILAAARACEPEVALVDTASGQLCEDAVKKSVFNVPNLIRLIGAAVFLVMFVFDALEESGLFVPKSEDVYTVLSITLFAAAFVMIAHSVIYKFLSNILKLRFLDENFLMMLAAIVAFVMGDYPEGAAIMLFYQVGEFFQKLAITRSRLSIQRLVAQKSNAHNANTALSPDTGDITEQVEAAVNKKAKSEQFITKFSRVYTPAMLGIAVIIGALLPLFSGENHLNWGYWIHIALTFLIVACPCALVLSIPMCFFGGVGAASRLGILFKGSNYLEALARPESIFFGDVLGEHASADIRALKTLGIKKTAFLTGGTSADAEAELRRADIDEAHADCRPEDKMGLILKHSKSGKTVFAGKDTSDVLALSAADVGIAFGNAGTDEAIEAADVVLMTDEISKIYTAVKIARRTRALVAINIGIVMVIKVLMLVLSFLMPDSGSLVLAEVADVGAAIIAIFIARTVLRYNPKPPAAADCRGHGRG
ncbi:MAG: heavy metal translocating P-type ATPase [Clostridiales bacterium]|jgi:cation transport ATPase|nr:heavy metal translocating P-type ATPase [Clostridiales bacterium]